MPDFNIRSDAVNVEEIMEQIRGRIREKRGVDYTEEQIRELATVRIEKLLDPRGIRSDLLEQFRKAQSAYEPPELPNFAFGEGTLYETHRAPIRWIRVLLRPILKLLFNPNPLIQALHIQSQLNTSSAEREAKREAARRAMDQMYYELIHNLVMEATRLGIEVKTLKMRTESLTSRLEFNERRARALESAVVYKPGDDRDPPAAPAERTVTQFQPPPPAPIPTQGVPAPVPNQTAPGRPSPTVPGQPDGPGQRSRRRRRRRGRRGGAPAAAVMAGGPSSADAPADSDFPAEASAPSEDTDGHESGVSGERESEETRTDVRPPDDEQ